MKSKNFEACGKIDNHAIVVGGSITGLLSARVLADSFELVTIIETDKLPNRPDAHKGVPQSTQPHILFTKGYKILEDFFPGIGSELSANGALKIDWPREFHYYSQGGWSANTKFPSDIVSFTCSRPLLEWSIRMRLTNFSNVRFFEQHRVTGLLCNPSQAQITGVRLRAIGGLIENELLAVLVVDASGRCSKAPDWLESLGFTPPPETIVEPFLTYTTRRYREPKDFQDDWKVMLISHSPPNGTRLGYLAKIEGGEWIATLGSYGEDFSPEDNEGFLEFARSLPSPRFYQAIVDAEPVSRIYKYKGTVNRLRHYEKVMLPRGFIALGDSVCALCPAYGQGITVSALSAIVLQNWMHKQTSWFLSDSLLTSSFQKSLAKNNSFHWNLATVMDSRFPTTSSARKPNPLGKLLNWYTNRLLQVSNRDPNFHTLLIEVGQLLKSPIVLFHPSVMIYALSKSVGQCLLSITKLK